MVRYINTITLNAPTYANNQELEEIDLAYVPWVNNTLCYYENGYSKGSFTNCINLQNVQNINENITNISRAFTNCYNLKNVSNIPNGVTNMSHTFENCISLVNSPSISNSVVNMQGTFENCSSLIISPDISNIESLKVMRMTFHGCISLSNTPVIPNNVEDMHGTFINCRTLINAPLIPNKVADISSCFSGCSSLVNAPDLINANSVTNMLQTFMGCRNLDITTENPLIIPNKVEDMWGTFENCFSLVNAPDLSNANSVTNMRGTFAYCSSLISSPVIPNSVENMSVTFYRCSSLTSAPVIPNSVTDMISTFAGCSSLVNAPDLSNANSVTNMIGAFNGCSSLNISTENPLIMPNNVENMVETFSYCSNLSGDIFIHSTKIDDAQNCFNGTNKNKDVYIPFNYENGVHTKTFNSFNIMAGYPYEITSDEDRVNGVLLIDINSEDIDLSDYEWNFTGGEFVKDVRLYNYINEFKTDITTPHIS